MIIDSHNHVMPEEALDVLRKDPSYGVHLDGDEWSGAHHVAFRIDPSFYDPAAKIAALDEASIDAAVVSVSPTLFFYEVPADHASRVCDASNEGMVRMCEHASGRLRWLANLPVQDPDGAAALYRRAVDAGCVGAALGTSIAGRRLDEPDFEVFWAAAAELGRPVLVHPAFNEPHAALGDFYLQNVVGNPLETTLTVERMICAGVLARHPRLRLLLVHGGVSFPTRRGGCATPALCARSSPRRPTTSSSCVSQLYFDSLTHDPLSLRFLVEWARPGHVVLGTDFPFDMRPSDPVGEIRRTLGDDLLAELGSRAPARLFDVEAWRT